MIFSNTKVSSIASVVGVRDNQLVGYGLVVGLNGTGDSSSTFTNQSLANMLSRMNVSVDAKDIKSKNVAAVIVTAQLTTFARQGDKIDVSIASIGDSSSLEGGELIITPLKGVDGNIYALASGHITIGGRNSGANSSSHSTVALVLNGAIIERELVYDLYSQTTAMLSLKVPSFSNAMKVQDGINAFFESQVAVALDPKSIKLRKPKTLSMVEFLAALDNIGIDYQAGKKIIINERTGTLVAGIDIAVDPVVITHQDIVIKIDEQADVSKAKGAALDHEVNIGAAQNKVSFKKGANTVANIARSLRKLGATPKDIISILQAMKKAGAIKVDIEII